MTFEEWWEKHGQYMRAGGGQYEITFAYEAWKEARKQGLEEAAALVNGRREDGDSDLRSIRDSIRALKETS